MNEVENVNVGQTVEKVAESISKVGNNKGSIATLAIAGIIGGIGLIGKIASEALKSR